MTHNFLAPRGGLFQPLREPTVQLAETAFTTTTAAATQRYQVHARRLASLEPNRTKAILWQQWFGIPSIEPAQSTEPTPAPEAPSMMDLLSNMSLHGLVIKFTDWCILWLHWVFMRSKNFYNWAIKGFEHAFEYTFAYFGPLITLIVYGLYFMQYLPIALALIIGYHVTTSCILLLIFYSYLAWRYLTGRVPWSAVRKAYSEGKSKRSPMYGPCTSNPLTNNYFTNGVKGRT